MQFQGFDWLSGHGINEPLYHAREVATINCFLVALEKEIRKAYQYYLINVFNKTIIPLALVGYEMIIANLVLCASLAIQHIQKARVE